MGTMATQVTMDDKIKSPLGKEFVEALSESKEIIDKVLGRGEIEKAVRQRRHNIMLANLEGFAQVPFKLGGEEAAEIQEAFQTIINSSIALYRGFVVKDAGTACLMTFETPTDVLRAGLKIESNVFRYNHAKGGKRALDIKIAINTDELVTSDQWDESFRRAVNLVAKMEKGGSDGETKDSKLSGTVKSPVRPLAKSKGDHEPHDLISSPGPQAKSIGQGSLFHSHWREFAMAVLIVVMGIRIINGDGFSTVIYAAGERILRAASFASVFVQSHFLPNNNVMWNYYLRMHPEIAPKPSNPAGAADQDEPEFLSSPIDPVMEEPRRSEMPERPSPNPDRLPTTSQVHRTLLEGFETDNWTLFNAEGTLVKTSLAPGREGMSLRVDFDLKHTKQWVQIKKDILFNSAEGKAIQLFIKSIGRNTNNFEIGLVDVDGSHFGYKFPIRSSDSWKKVTIDLADFIYLKGGNSRLDRVNQIVFSISAIDGGEGTFLIDDLSLIG
jgi:hypothetical protein